MRGFFLAISKSKKRAVYFWAILLAVPVLLFIWLMRPEEGFIRWLYPAFILMCAGWAWRLYQGAHVGRIERETIGTVTLFFTIKLAYYLFWGDLERNWVEIESTYWVMAFVMVLLYIVFDARMGLVYSLALAVATLILGLLRLGGEVAQGLYRTEFLAFVRSEMRLLAMAGLLYALAIVKDQLALANRQVEEMHALARTDPLTRLPNRLALSELLEGAAQHMHGLYLVLLDIDRFKQINDRFGHAAGDEVLKEVARRLRVSMRKEDVLGRWGGEEFMILMRGEGQQDVLAAVERLREDISFWPFKLVGSVSASFGVAEGHIGDSGHALVERADKALYEAKRLGRNRVEMSPA
ncbi:diguanylate cyclase [Meiothermus taiwanensis WR-220]|uniref:Diguanylate cyclase n=2 Tax=Meiothermus taiwanensis TaxID=172827 RepID=A0ABN5LYS1_9DEIN|nr:GGDEF domain-containing protein [Meiothermus taiwanensis]AWR87316.1 diguanylate cyclase [Meiothermus taiwanensis WR-220]KIQ53521.1 diguanylate cyclase [Meiothermus taiwanensis]KZK15296.1 diguanylate cyclase [Meiothermus taiwanensis]RIH76112.1 putative diguanylate cyclase YdaM [Meiothermus taiwanensis]